MRTVLVTVFIIGIVVAVIRKMIAATATKKREFTEQEYDQHYAAKTKALERVLGPMHHMVGHAIIPFQLGGSVDMYYFPNGIAGTGFATMELIEPDGTGPKPNRVGTYELVAFTKQRMPAMEAGQLKKDDSFTVITSRMCRILTLVSLYSFQAVLEPGDTCEIPGEDENTHSFVFDEYDPHGTGFIIDGKTHCLLACIEVFRRELEYARQNGSDALLKRLKLTGNYPYSDLDRQPVI
jgi:hypothetical protein